jgi:dienelactone hydrolase
VRSRFSDPSDWVSVKEQLLAGPPPLLAVASTQLSPGEVVHRGTVELPRWTTPSLTAVTRDTASGKPASSATEAVPFVLRIPTGVPSPMPVVIYQHGSPGSPEAIVDGDNTFLVEAGYAVIGIQDVTNRRFGEDRGAIIQQTLLRVVVQQALPLTSFQTHADILGLLRAIQGMGVPGNFPEIDPTRILYRGFSFGAHHSLGFLPFAPEVTAAASHVGSGRIYHANLHQLDYNDLMGAILAALPDARPRDIVWGMAALQNEEDRDDPHLLARYLYREPLAIGGLTDSTPPSLLWIEGIGDSQIPNESSRASASELGIPSVRPLAGPSPVLTEVDAPLSGNIAPGVTAGHFQYDPPQTPSCVAAGEAEGHFCATFYDEVHAQVLHFFATALAGAAEIVDPLP